MTGASPSSCATRAPSSVADIGRIRRSSRRPRWQSRASASPRSASSERSWNSSNSTAPTPDSSGSSRIMRVNTPSVTTSMRVFGPDFETMRARSPTRSPTPSAKVCAMRSAAARAAIRRGSSTRILRPPSQLSSISASGTRVVLPAPGGATRTADERAAKAVRTSSRIASMGSGSANFMPGVSRKRLRFATVARRSALAARVGRVLDVELQPLAAVEGRALDGAGHVQRQPPGVHQQFAQRLTRGAEGDALELGAVGRLQHAAHVVLADDLGELHVGRRKGEARRRIALPVWPDAGDEVDQLVGDTRGCEGAIDVERVTLARLAYAVDELGVQEVLQH